MNRDIITPHFNVSVVMPTILTMHKIQITSPAIFQQNVQYVITPLLEPAAFDHARTSFPLTGAHISVNCQNCHESGYTGTPTECYSCHQQDFENVQDPNHVGGYSTTCTDCHTTIGWDDLTNFNHNVTQFVLTGAHITANCIACHQQGYNNTPNQCIGCHQDDFNNTTDPNHQVSGFPTTCENCHTTSAWTPATFDHNFYPISNHHNNVTCNECHSQPNYQPQRLSCHLQDFNEGHNPGDPTDCWACHSTNNWDSNFNHGGTNFPLTGAHLSISCQDCHASGYQGTPTECVAWSSNQLQQHQQSCHEALMLPTNCGVMSFYRIQVGSQQLFLFTISSLNYSVHI